MGAAPARDSGAYLGLWREAWSLDEPGSIGAPAASPTRSGAQNPARSRPELTPVEPAGPGRGPRPRRSRRHAPPPLAVPSRTRDRRQNRLGTSRRTNEGTQTQTSSHGRSKTHSRRRSTRPDRQLILPVVFLGAWLAVVLVAPLVLNVMGMQAEWRLAQLEQKHDELGAERAQLKTQVAALSSAPRIREEADRLGLSLAAEVDYLIMAGSGGEVVAALDPEIRSD